MAENLLPSARFMDIDTSEVLGHIASTAPIGSILNYEDLIPRIFLEHDFSDGPQADLLNMVKPFVTQVIDDFQEETGLAADSIRRLDFVNLGYHPKASPSWHRDKLFPGERLYVATPTESPTEFAYGQDHLRFSRLPYRFPVDRMTNLLLSLGRLEIVSAAGKTAILTSGVVHRSGQAASDSRPSFSVAIYNHEYARSQLINKLWEGWIIKRAERRSYYAI